MIITFLFLNGPSNLLFMNCIYVCINYEIFPDLFFTILKSVLNFYNCSALHLSEIDMQSCSNTDTVLSGHAYLVIKIKSIKCVFID